MPSTFRRFTPLFILLVIIWSFQLSFTFGLLLLSTSIGVGICVYHFSIKKWQDILEEDELESNFPLFPHE